MSKMAKLDEEVAAVQCPHCGGWMRVTVAGYQNHAAVDRAKRRAERMARHAEEAEQKEQARYALMVHRMRTTPSTIRVYQDLKAKLDGRER